MDSVQIEIAGVLSAKAEGIVGIVAVTALVLIILWRATPLWPKRALPTPQNAPMGPPLDSRQIPSETPLPSSPAPARDG